MQARSTIVVGLLLAIAAILHIVETWIPVPIPIPGAKLGLANIVSLVALLWLGWRTALTVAVGRVLLASFFGGGLLGPAFGMSLVGAVGSVLVMVYSFRLGSNYLSVVGVSVLGAVSHSALQLIVAALLVSNIGIFWYLPWLILFAVPTGIVTGICAAAFLRHIDQLPFSTNNRKKR